MLMIIKLQVTVGHLTGAVQQAVDRRLLHSCFWDVLCVFTRPFVQRRLSYKMLIPWGKHVPYAQ